MLLRVPKKMALQSLALAAFGVVFAVLFGLYAMRTIGDPDFWWHLKTGQFIVENRALPTADPFNFTGDPAVSLRERVILQGYWLWQVTAYGLFQWLGFKGIKLLSFLTLGGIYVSIGRSLLRSQVRAAVALPLAGLSLFLFQNFYALERPQIISFLGSTILVGYFVAIWRGERPTPWIYPLMIVWANVHGGVVIGVCLLGLFAVGSLWAYRDNQAYLRSILLWCGGGMLATLINPNGPGYFIESFRVVDQGLKDWVTEYRSTWWLFVNKTWLVLLVWGLGILQLWALVRARRQARLAEWLVAGFLVAIGVMYQRNIAFVVVALIPLVAFTLERALVLRPVGNLSWQRFAGPVAVVTATALLGYICIMDWRWRPRGDLNADGVPEGVVEFMRKAPLEGNIFNQYFWGGYLLWRLHPQYKLFIDGRGIDEQVFRDYMLISSVSLQEEGERPEYQRLLDQYRVDYVVMHNQMEFGRVQKLLKYLLPDKGWVPVYLDNSGFVLARVNEKNRPILEQYRISKKVFLDRLLGSYNRTLLENPRRADFYLGRGELLGYIGRYDEAERDFAMVRQLDPDYPYLAEKLSQLQKLREKTAIGN